MGKKIFFMFQTAPDAVDITWNGDTTRHLTKFSATMFLSAIELAESNKTIIKEVRRTMDQINRNTDIPLGKPKKIATAFRLLKKHGLSNMYEVVHRYYAEHICERPTIVSFADTDRGFRVEVRLPSHVIRGDSRFDLFKGLNEAVKNRLLRIDEEEKLRKMLINLPILPAIIPTLN